MANPISTRLRLGFAGTPPFAATILHALLERHEVVAVYCRPPQRTGRGRKLRPSAVQDVAQSRGIEVSTPRTLRGQANALADLRIDALIVAAYGLILPKSILGTPRHGCINVHASLLPRWRGAAPIERAMMAGDTVTGISIMQMEEGLDTGPVLRQVDCLIRRDDTGDSLRERLAIIGSATLLDCLDHLGQAVPVRQPLEGVTYAEKLRPLDSQIDWAASATDIALKIRALNSRQPAFCYVKGERIRLPFGEAIESPAGAQSGTVTEIGRNGMTIACGSGSVRISRVALSRGQGRPMDIAALINGYAGLILMGQVFDPSS